MKNFLESEESFKAFLDTLCCNYCRFLVDKQCTEKDAKEHDKEKEDLRKCCEEEYIRMINGKDEELKVRQKCMIQWNKDGIEDINCHYVCDKHKYSNVENNADIAQ